MEKMLEGKMNRRRMLKMVGSAGIVLAVSDAFADDYTDITEIRLELHDGYSQWSDQISLYPGQPYYVVYRIMGQGNNNITARFDEQNKDSKCKYKACKGYVLARNNNARRPDLNSAPVYMYGFNPRSGGMQFQLTMPPLPTDSSTHRIIENFVDIQIKGSNQTIDPKRPMKNVCRINYKR
jgi:hypothetical protein